MFVVRYVYLLALGTWLGSMLTLGALVAPALFRGLQAHDPVQGRSLAATLFGTILHSYHYLAYGAGVVLLGCLVVMALLTRPRGVGLRALIVVAMLGLSIYSGYVVSPGVQRVRDAVGAPIETLDPLDARRMEFDRLHRLSTTLMGITIAGCLVLLGWEAREAR